MTLALNETTNMRKRENNQMRLRGVQVDDTTSMETSDEGQEERKVEQEKMLEESNRKV